MSTPDPEKKLARLCVYLYETVIRCLLKMKKTNELTLITYSFCKSYSN